MGRAPWLSLSRGKARRRKLRGTAREPWTEASLPHDSANTHSLAVFFLQTSIGAFLILCGDIC
jgi:hypothetical protein